MKEHTLKRPHFDIFLPHFAIFSPHSLLEGPETPLSPFFGAPMILKIIESALFILKCVLLSRCLGIAHNLLPITLTLFD